MFDEHVYPYMCTRTGVRCQPLIEHLSRIETEQMSANRCLTIDSNARTIGVMIGPKITARQKEILVFIEAQMRDRGYPPSVREIGEAVGLTSPSTVHSHLNTLERLGYLRRDATKPRAIEVRWDSNSGAVMERRPMRHVPLVGDVAAGTDVLAEENVEELFPVPVDFTGEGELFMLRVRGDSMIEAGILDGDFVIAVQQPSAANGEIVVAGIPGGEATVKTFKRTGGRITLMPANSTMEPLEFPAADVQVYGRVVTVMRRL
jgi:repressor LexA